MSLIKLEDVLHRIYSEPNTSDKLYQDINSLPQYNPEEVLREMISHQRARKAITNVTDAYNNWRLDVLEEILTRIAPNK